MTQDYQLAQCEGKHAFESYRMAKQVRNSRKDCIEPRGVYKCQYCHKWHLGRSKAKKPIKSIIIED